MRLPSNSKIILRTIELTITILKGHELMLYEALSVIVGPFLIFTIVKMLRTIINDQTLKFKLQTFPSLDLQTSNRAVDSF